jgi:nicotinamidase-related amidase
VFKPAEAKGGSALDCAKTAVCFIEYQNEFTTENGKMHEAVKGVMEETGMLAKSAAVAAKAREAGAKVFHIAVQWKEDHSDNPNSGLGILAGGKGGALFTEGTWGAAFCEAMTPQEGDVTIRKHGLDAFPGSDLEEKLKEYGIEHVALAGFMTNCCIESTMRTAYEKGYNVITLTDCCACGDSKAQEASAGEGGTFSMFSAQKTADEFTAMLAGESKE